MKNYCRLAIVIIGMLSISACGGGNDAGSGDTPKKIATKGSQTEIVIDGTKHNFPFVGCVKSRENLAVALKNDTISLIVHRYDPSRFPNKWAVNYMVDIDEGRKDVYTANKYNLTQKGNHITGTATAVHFEKPEKSVDISINIICSKII